MISFLENEEKIRSMVTLFAEKYNFQISITKDQPNGWYEELKFFNNKCKFIIYNDMRYEEIGVESFVNPRSEVNNKYHFLFMGRLRNISRIDKTEDIEELSEDASLEDIEDYLELIENHFKDILEGNFKNLDDEGYWESLK